MRFVMYKDYIIVKDGKFRKWEIYSSYVNREQPLKKTFFVESAIRYVDKIIKNKYKNK